MLFLSIYIGENCMRWHILEKILDCGFSNACTSLLALTRTLPVNIILINRSLFLIHYCLFYVIQANEIYFYPQKYFFQNDNKILHSPHVMSLQNLSSSSIHTIMYINILIFIKLEQRFSHSGRHKYICMSSFLKSYQDYNVLKAFKTGWY